MIISVTNHWEKVVVFLMFLWHLSKLVLSRSGGLITSYGIGRQKVCSFYVIVIKNITAVILSYALSVIMCNYVPLVSWLITMAAKCSTSSSQSDIVPKPL